jgi:hypothetical protein
MSTTLTTDFNVNNENYANKDLSEIFSPCSPYGFIYYYDDFTCNNWTPQWDPYGSGACTWNQGTTDNPGNITFSTSSGDGSAGIWSLSYFPVHNSTVEFICRTTTNFTGDNQIVYAGVATAVNPVPVGGNSAYIGIVPTTGGSGTSIIPQFRAFINGSVIPGNLGSWTTNSWFYLKISFNYDSATPTNSTITFSVSQASTPNIATTVTSINPGFDFTTPNRIFFEQRINSTPKTFEVDYIGMKYISDRAPFV